MPRFYFPSWNGERFLGDEDGVEVAKAEEARALAVESLLEMAADVLPQALEERVLRVCLTGPGQERLAEFRLIFQMLGQDLIPGQD
jgi:hypothetical protein